MDRRNDPTPPTEAPSLATPLAWAGGSLLLTGTTFLVSAIALVRAFGSLFH
ncbi:MAG: hypothetical protein K2X49_25500 [Acetobacteraceae bacterium]|nr:hypothetical protein [Acetobacteraceae bacterium]